LVAGAKPAPILRRLHPQGGLRGAGM